MEATELTSYFETFGPRPESTLSVAISFFLVGAMDCASDVVFKRTCFFSFNSEHQFFLSNSQIPSLIFHH